MRISDWSSDVCSSDLFAGFIEGDKLSRGDVDVIVHDGFSGNIALKTIEGTARFVTDLLRRAFTSSTRSKNGFLISRPATELLRHHLDPKIGGASGRERVWQYV